MYSKKSGINSNNKSKNQIDNNISHNVILNIDVDNLKINNILPEYKNSASDAEFIELINNEQNLKEIPSNIAVDYSN